MQQFDYQFISERQRITALPFFLLFVLLCSPTFSYAKTNDFVQKDDVWNVINHYDENGISDIINENYFIAKDGRTNPVAEYEAFTSVLKKYLADGSGVETLCQFPARMTYMVKKSGWFQSKDRPVCEAYNAEVNPKNIDSISLLFASGYFDNPSSYYGHTLLKFNYNDKVLNQKTLNSSLNYGADSKKEDGTLTYVLKGLFGGYQASYQRNNEFINTHLYTNGQLRDIWEYKLKLTSEQMTLVEEHSWELMRAKFTYYFFNDNCAHRISDLIERATSSKLAYSHGFWTLPIQVIEHAKMGPTPDGQETLIASEAYHPSLKSTFSQRYEDLSAQEKKAFLNFFKVSDAEKYIIVHGLQEKILLLILEHLDIQSAKLTIEKSKNKEGVGIQEHRRIVLAEFLQRPPGYKQSHLSWGEDNTLLNYKPISVLRSGLLRRNDKNYASFNYQMSNNDLMDAPMYGQERSKVIMGSLQLDVSDDSIQIRDLTFIDIMNLNTNPLPMWLTNEYSWQLRVAYDHRNNICNSCGSLGVTGKFGKSIRFNKNVMGYTMAGATLRHREVSNFGFVSLVSDSAIIYNHDALSTYKIGLMAIYDPFKEESDAVLSGEYAYKLTSDKDIRISYEQNAEYESSMSIRFGYYFN